LKISQTESTEKIQGLTAKLQDYERELSEQKEQLDQLTELTEKQREEINQLENERNSNVTDLK